MAMYYNGKKVRNLYYNGKCITRLALGKEMTRLVEGDDFVRAEWLKASTSTAADMATLPINATSLGFNHKRISGSNYGLFVTQENYDYYRDAGSRISIWKSGYIYRSTILSSAILISCSSNDILINGESFPIYGYPIKAVRIVASGSSGMATLTSAITVNEAVRYIPCRLLRPIPAALDANGIARNAGDCGMYDAVSGKFYGNVANGGTFTVEPSLVEGVDYQRYKWLKGDDTSRIINSYNVWQNKLEVEVGNIQDNQFSSNYNDTGVYLAAVYNSGGGNPYMLVAFREGGSKHIADIRYAEMPEKVVMTFFQENSIAYCNQNGILKVGDEITQSLWDKDVPVRIISAKMSYIREVLPDGSYRSDLTPCRLLRPIPAALDANGIARNAGECGMYDSISGKFYGNVASSGAFTVSDN